ncbi:hypothetical protein GCM10023149_25580 [Mucilaginibacter gynuensis]|uniref:Aminoglycoside phosphotransferase domain-containing protein n=2 Tax=Mucilaginibacter gynuensis TaxID=1302236 RepID=A0ABP8GGZ1_9SPHI
MRNVSDTYLLEDANGRYIFKIYRDAHRKHDEIKAEVELLNALTEGGAKVAYPLTDLSGQQIQEFNAIEGTRYGVMFAYAEGKVVADLTDEHLETIGREMAAVHNITSAVKLKYPRKPYTVETMLREPIATIAPAFKELPDEYAYLSSASAKVAAHIEAFDLSQFRTGYCHYDFLPKNFHFTDAANVIFFDFDFAGYGLLANDIASFYIHLFLEVMNGKLTQEKADEQFAVFVAAYRTVRPLSNEELAAVPYLGFAFWVFYFGFHYENFDDWSSIFFTTGFIKGRVALIKKWADRHFKG